MMPLCTTATSPATCGCAFASLGRPCVAQRVCPMPVVPGERALRERRLEVRELADGADDLDAARPCAREARGVVAAVLEAAQPLDEDGRALLRADVADDSAHGCALQKMKA